MVHYNAQGTMSRSHSWIYGSVKGGGQQGDFDFRGLKDYGEHVVCPLPEVYSHFESSNTRRDVRRTVLPASVRLKENRNYNANNCKSSSSVSSVSSSTWRNYNPAFNDCPEHSVKQQVGGVRRNNNCENSSSSGGAGGGSKKFVGSVRKLTWKSLKQVVVKKRPSLDNVLNSSSNNKNNNTNKKQQPAAVAPPQAPDILFVPNYFFPPVVVSKQNFYSSCTDLYEDFPGSAVPTASVRVRPKQIRQAWPCEFGPLPNYHRQEEEGENRKVAKVGEKEEEEEEEGEEIYHSEWDLRQFMPYDVWLTENSPPQRQNNRVQGKSHCSRAENNKGSISQGRAGQQQQQSRQSILRPDVTTAYELNNNLKSDDDLSSDSRSNSSDGLPCHHHNLLPRVSGKFSPKKPATGHHNGPLSQQKRAAGSNGNHLKPVSSPSNKSQQKSASSPSNGSQKSTSSLSDRLCSKPAEPLTNGNQAKPSNSSTTTTSSHKITHRSSPKTTNPKPTNCSKPPQAASIQRSTESPTNNGPSRPSDSLRTDRTKQQPSPRIHNSSSDNLYSDRHSKIPTPKSSHQQPPKRPSPPKPSNAAPTHQPNIISSHNITRNSSPTVRETVKCSELSSESLEDADAAAAEEKNVENVRKNALKRNNKSRASSTVAAAPTIKEESDEDEGGEKNVYAVKIIVSQNNNATDDYVKPILKRESVYETASAVAESVRKLRESTIAAAAIKESPEDINNSRKKVQFDQNNPVVCGGLTDDGGTESEDAQVWDDNPGEDQEEPEEGTQGIISWSDEGKTSSASILREEDDAHDGDASVNNLTRENNRHPTEEKKKEDIKVNRNDSLHSNAFPLKANRMVVKTPERKTVQARPTPSSSASTVQIITNPNSLLFHDTTRIRLNQVRPSINQTFKISGKEGDDGSSGKLKQSSSFRQMGSGTLRPKEPPPPPPPRAQMKSSLQKVLELKSAEKKRTVTDSTAVTGKCDKNRRKGLGRNQVTRSSLRKKATTACMADRVGLKGAESVVTNGESMKNEDTSIEIVTKENSVSEIRIYSGTQSLNIDRSTEAAQILKNYGNAMANANHAATGNANLQEAETKSRSTSVVLIINTDTDTVTDCASLPYGKIQPLETCDRVESPFPGQHMAPSPKSECSSDSGFANNSGVDGEKMEPLYDDVVAASNAEESGRMILRFSKSRSNSPPPLPTVPPPNESYSPPLHNVYNRIRPLEANGTCGSVKNDPADRATLYDDTMSIVSYESAERVKDEDVPLYDDVLNLLGQDSDSGAEIEESIPPPLPAQRPTHPLPKVSTDLPMLNFPILNKYMDRLSNQKVSKDTSGNGISPSSSSAASSLPKAFNGNHQETEDILERTRTLLNELSQKFTTLKFSSPADYATYISKVLLSSSSDSSSGVEEDYGSEKNYLITSNNNNNSPNVLTSRQSTVPQPLINARERFLDSMKAEESTSSSPQAGAHEEPIYEEIGEGEGNVVGDDDSNGPIYSDAFAAKSMFDGASRNEILTFLEAIRERLSTSTSSDSCSNSFNRSEKERAAAASAAGEMERNDSGIGSGSEFGSLVALSNGGGSKSAMSSSSQFSCTDCNDTIDTSSATVTTGPSSPTARYAPTASPPSSDLLNQPLSSSTHLCQACTRKRRERKEILQEIYETEVKYGRDLKIIQEEFYSPIQIAGLLSKEQLQQVFLNVDQLLRVNTQLTGMLKSVIDEAVKAQDEDLTGVNMGKIFMEYGDTMMSAFEAYCTQQANAGALLTQLEKEKELLRIFLRVSQMENSVLRRMNLPAFLMVPVQRVTRYPLLLARLLKVTPAAHPSRAELFAAQIKIEQHLESMNKRTREASSIRLWRRISIMNGGNNGASQRQTDSSDVDDNFARIRKMALDVLDWTNFADVTCVAEERFDSVEFNGKVLRNIQGCFIVRGKNLELLAKKMEQPVFFPPKEDLGIDAKLVLVRVKNARLSLLREPVCLSKCIVSQGENDNQDCIEINEIITKNTMFLRVADSQRTAELLRVLQCYAACVGHWRRRRGGLANIMMNGMIRHL